MTTKGKTGTIHGIEVRARQATQQPTVKISTQSAADRQVILSAAQTVYEQHQSVIQALANR
ncbi:hypothetical protein [Burkholderia glumae]|uniref:hypothetical protein n=1 Tax=Burkholderia glumae TaxID=337 RepID=UPI0003F4F190|nr:hypothetical protein [Burkholderia glumae]QKM52181.1 hypothetical protein CG017_00170 [Burkholderia glumae]